jgi:hypothetical protein
METKMKVILVGASSLLLAATMMAQVTMDQVRTGLKDVAASIDSLRPEFVGKTDSDSQAGMKIYTRLEDIEDHLVNSTLDASLTQKTKSGIKLRLTEMDSLIADLQKLKLASTATDKIAKLSTQVKSVETLTN